LATALQITLVTPAGPAYAGASPVPAAPDARFGDSTWVAPYASATESSTPVEPGPRVRAPDHTRTYESVLRFPFRVIAFPFRLIGIGGEYGASVIENQLPRRGTTARSQPHHLLPYLDVAEQARLNFGTLLFLGPSAEKPGIVEQLAVAGGKSDWQLAHDAEFRAQAAENGGGERSRNGFTARGTGDFAWSLANHRHAALDVELMHGEGDRAIGIGAAGLYQYRPNLLFLGIGTDADEDRRSIYLAEEGRGELFLRLGATRTRTARLVTRISHISVRDGRDGEPGIEEIYGPADQVPFLGTSTSVIQYGVQVALAKLDRVELPSRGVEARGEVWRVNDLDGGDLTWTEWQAEGRAYVPVFARRRVLAFRARYASVDPSADSPPVPFYRLPESSGDQRFLAFDSGHFRDQRLALSQVEYRWWIWEKLWAVGFAQLGWVAPSAADLRFDAVHESYGGGFRGTVTQSFLYRLDIAHGSEGTETDLKFGIQF
jgi:hypothetical protein